MPRSRTLQDRGFYALSAVTAITFVFEIFFVFLRTPIEARMGIVQKIFYFHVPAAYAMYLGAGACFLGSAAYFVRPTEARGLGGDIDDAGAGDGAERVDAAVVWGRDGHGGLLRVWR